MLAEWIYKTQHAKPASYCPAWPGENARINQVQVRDIMSQQVHPDHNHEKEECEFSTNTEQNRMFFSSHQLQRSSEDATNAIAWKEHETVYAGGSLSIDHHFHQQLFIPCSHQ